MSNKIIIYVDGMTCTNCQSRIQRKLRKTAGVIAASVSYSGGTAKVIYDESTSPAEIMRVIESLGYKASERRTGKSIRIELIAVIAGVYVFLQSSGLINIFVPSGVAEAGMSYSVLFMLGLLTSVHCVAMCGGINLSQTLRQSGMFSSSLAYNFGRVVSYTVSGFVLGLIGYIAGNTVGVSLSADVQAAVKVIAGVLMLMMGTGMLNLFPALRRFSLRLPKISSSRITSPVIVGLLNGFMPCGPLQAMWFAALASGTPVRGAISMFAFAMGTLPLMLGLGSVVSALGRRFTGKVMTAGAVMVCVMGLVMISQGLSLAGLNVSVAGGAQDAAELSDEQVVNSTLQPGRYPNIRVRAGVPVKWVIDAPNGSVNGCNYRMYIPAYGLWHTFRTGENVIAFTPEKAGTINYSCWMGMINGTITVY